MKRASAAIRRRFSSRHPEPAQSPLPVTSLDEETVHNQEQETVLNNHLASFIATENSPRPGPSSDPDDDDVQNKVNRQTFLNGDLASFIATGASPLQGHPSNAEVATASDAKDVQDRVNRDLADFCQQPAAESTLFAADDDSPPTDADFRTPARRPRARHRDHRARFGQSVEQPIDCVLDFSDAPARSPHPSDFSSPRDHPRRRLRGVEPARPDGLERALWDLPAIRRRAASDLTVERLRHHRRNRKL